jgi:hypothetical protein
LLHQGGAFPNAPQVLTDRFRQVDVYLSSVDFWGVRSTSICASNSKKLKVRSFLLPHSKYSIVLVLRPAVQLSQG